MTAVKKYVIITLYKYSTENKGEFMNSTVFFKALIIAVIALSLIICGLGISALAEDGDAGTDAGTDAGVTTLLGDINRNGKVTVYDVVALRKLLAEHDYSTGEMPKHENGNFNDNDYIDLEDLAALRELTASGKDPDQYLVEKQGIFELHNNIELRAHEDGSFKVILISDIQCYNEKGLVNSGTLDVVEAMIEAEKPDLVLLVGDNVWSRNSKEELRSYLQVMAKPMEDRNIPWAHIYGNHDAEDNDPWYWAIDKDEQQEVYEEIGRAHV